MYVRLNLDDFTPKFFRGRAPKTTAVGMFIEFLEDSAKTSGMHRGDFRGLMLSLFSNVGFKPLIYILMYIQYITLPWEPTTFSFRGYFTHILQV